MNRRVFLGGGLSAVSAAALGFYAQSIEDRVASLEGEVDRLGRRVDALESRTGGSEPIAPIETPALAGVVTVEGVGTSLSEKFTLEPGRYRVDATVQVSKDIEGFIAVLRGPSNAEDLLFNELIQTGGPWTGSVTTEIGEAGEYFVEISNTTSPWSLTFALF